MIISKSNLIYTFLEKLFIKHNHCLLFTFNKKKLSDISGNLRDTLTKEYFNKKEGKILKGGTNSYC